MFDKLVKGKSLPLVQLAAKDYTGQNMDGKTLAQIKADVELAQSEIHGGNLSYFAEQLGQPVCGCCKGCE